MTGEKCFKRLLDLQNELYKSEEERLLLQLKFKQMIQQRTSGNDLYIHSSEECPDDYDDLARKQRNAKILESLENIEKKVAVLTAKTEQFQELYNRYHHNLNRMRRNRAIGNRPSTTTNFRFQGYTHNTTKTTIDYKPRLCSYGSYKCLDTPVKNYIQLDKECYSSNEQHWPELNFKRNYYNTFDSTEIQKQPESNKLFEPHRCHFSLCTNSNSARNINYRSQPELNYYNDIDLKFNLNRSKYDYQKSAVKRRLEETKDKLNQLLIEYKSTPYNLHYKSYDYVIPSLNRSELHTRRTYSSPALNNLFDPCDRLLMSKETTYKPLSHMMQYTCFQDETCNPSRKVTFEDQMSNLKQKQYAGESKSDDSMIVTSTDCLEINSTLPESANAVHELSAAEPEVDLQPSTIDEDSVKTAEQVVRKMTSTRKDDSALQVTNYKQLPLDSSETKVEQPEKTSAKHQEESKKTDIPDKVSKPEEFVDQPTTEEYYTQPQYDEHGQIVQYDNQYYEQYDDNGQPIPYQQYDQGQYQYDENQQMMYYPYDENGQYIGEPQYDQEGNVVPYDAYSQEQPTKLGQEAQLAVSNNDNVPPSATLGNEHELSVVGQNQFNVIEALNSESTTNAKERKILQSSVDDTSKLSGNSSEFEIKT